MVSIFGIRHHGPGSAKSLKRALMAFEPDIVLIEGPPDANDMIVHVANAQLKPPVAILVYNPKDLRQAAYYPFAQFSPEWQAMKYALKNELPVQFMDLPQELHFSLNKKAEEDKQLSIIPEEKTVPPKYEEEQEDETIEETPPLPDSKKEILLHKDPLAYIAQLAGYNDSERWWEITFEQQENPTSVFPAIIELMTALREEQGKEIPPREQLREAKMRQIIRQAQKEGYQKIAVVCGAWHVPALHQLDQYKASKDKALLKGIKKTKTKSTWVPWTFDRLSVSSGYGAGVISPAWYHLLFGQRKHIIIRWMTKVAHLFRKEDLDASSAHVIEAVRLAETLATLRQLSIPGIEELYEAAVTIFCEGHDSQMKLIEQKLIIGDVMGKVPAEIPVVPFQNDLEKTIKSARLTKYRNTTEALWLKASETKPRGGIDLREPSDQIKSHLLHRLNLLGINWGDCKIPYKTGSHGDFSEQWKLMWKPNFAIKIIEAGMWGNTVYSACINFVKKRLEKTDTLPALTELLSQAMKANLNEVFDPLLQQLQNLAAITKDVHHLMDALPQLIKAFRYGSSRLIDVSLLKDQIQQMITRICISLPNACVSINEEAARNLLTKLLACNEKISLLNEEEHIDLWHQSLTQIINLQNVNGILTGACTRILFDKGIYNSEVAGQKMHYALSRANDPIAAAQWIEGFLHGSGLLLIHNPRLWNILDQWVSDLPMDSLKELLPILRRSFANFSNPVRQKLMARAKKGTLIETNQQDEDSLHQERAAKVLPTIKLLLGIGR